MSPGGVRGSWTNYPATALKSYWRYDSVVSVFVFFCKLNSQ